jgi:hypothetical protein
VEPVVVVRADLVAGRRVRGREGLARLAERVVVLVAVVDAGRVAALGGLGVAERVLAARVAVRVDLDVVGRRGEALADLLVRRQARRRADDGAVGVIEVQVDVGRAVAGELEIDARIGIDDDLVPVRRARMLALLPFSVTGD